MSHNDLISTREALKLLGLTQPSTITRYVQDGKLTPATKLPGPNGAYVFHRADVVALVDQRRAELYAAIERLNAS